MIVRLVVEIDTDVTARSPLELQLHAREQYVAAVMQAHADGLIELAVAEELIRAMQSPAPRK